MTRTAVIIQARLGSVRLPGKVLLEVNGRSVLAHVIERAKRIEGVDDVIVAVPTKDATILGNIAKTYGAKLYGGAEFDVLSRITWAAKWYSADIIIRLTADCPTIDPEVSSLVLKRFHSRQSDYYSNVWTDRVSLTTDGLDTEVMTRAALETAYALAPIGSAREHVTSFIRANPKMFTIGETSAGAHRGRWSLDTPEDLVRVRDVFAALGDTFGWQDVVALEERAA